LKLRHEYLAVATFGIAVTIQLVCLNWEYLTGGTLGLIGIPNPSKAWSDGAQSLTFERFGSLMKDLKDIANAVGRKL
jgi:ABC-type branched-subunit amino acid transport system permease subunit